MEAIEKNLPKNYDELKKLYLSSEKEIAKIKKEIQALEQEKATYKAKFEFLFEQFKLSKQRQFGSSSESNLLQDSLFDEAQAPIPEAAQARIDTEKESISYERKKRSGNAKRQKLPDYLPREEKIYDIPQAQKKCDCCGGEKTCFGKETSEQLKVIPPKIVVISHQRLKYCCKGCEGEISIAPKPMLFLPKSIADASLVAYTAVMKYTDHIPLYRQEAIWTRNKVHLPRNTTCGWIIKAATHCEPLYDVMINTVVASGYAQVDETPVQVLKEPGRKNTQKSFMWVYRKAVGPPIIIYEYQQTRQSRHVKHFLKDFTGYLQTDAYQGYGWSDSEENIVHVGCMAHARRPFAELVKLNKKKKGLAYQALEMIGKLYQIESEIKNEDEKTKYKIRQEKSKPQLEKLKAWLMENVNKAPPKGKLGQAMKYMLNHWENLSRYIDDGKLHIDNNKVENAIRPFALGKKNWLFAGNPSGAKAGAVLYSLLMTAKENGLDQHAYLTFVFESIRFCETPTDYLKLLPTHLTDEQRHRLTL